MVTIIQNTLSLNLKLYLVPTIQLCYKKVRLNVVLFEFRGSLISHLDGRLIRRLGRRQTHLVALRLHDAVDLRSQLGVSPRCCQYFQSLHKES